jgi:hypothetical protein
VQLSAFDTIVEAGYRYSVERLGRLEEDLACRLFVRMTEEPKQEADARELEPSL